MTRTILYNLPPTVRALCSEDVNGEQLIILNARLTREANSESFEHELRHKKDFSHSQNVDFLECKKHGR